MSAPKKDERELAERTQDGLALMIHNGASKAWLLKTTYRLCIDRLRKRATRPQVNLADLSVMQADHGPGPEHGAMMADL